MATPIELATGYVTVAVETSRVAKGVGRAFAGAERIGASAGRDMGQSMAREWAKTKPDMDQLAKDVERAESRATTAVQRNAVAQENAKRKVAIAQAKANEATEKYGSESSQALGAVDRLATAQQKLEATTLKATTEQDKLNRELKDAKDAYASAEKAADQAASSSSKAAGKYATGWRGVGQKMRTYLVSGVKSAVGEADDAADDGDGATKYAAGWKGVGQRLKTNLRTAVKQASEGAEDEADDGGKRAGGGFADSFKGAVAGLAAYVGVREIGQTLWSSVQESGNLEQSIGAIDSVFKSSAVSMHNWAKSASTDVGLSANEFNELGTLIGAQLKNGGIAMDKLAPKTNQLVGLGADLSSMFGGTTREAVEALSSALKGEQDPIERYGVTLTAAKVEAEYAALGFKKTGKEMSQEGKTAATLSLIMKQTTDAHGNFARESDTFAHKQQVMQAKWLDLKAAMGEAFMPVLTSVFGYIGDTVIPAAEAFAQKIAAGASVVGDIAGALADTAQWWGPFAIGAAVAATALGAWLLVSKGYLFAAAATIARNYALAASWVAANWPILAVVAGITLVVGALILAYNKIGWFKAAVDWMFNGIKVVIGAVVSWWTGTAWPALLVGFQAIGAVATWLWTNVMAPVWSGIKVVIGAVVGWIVTTVVPWIQAGIALLGAVFSWLYVNVIQPVWAGIQVAVAAFATWFVSTAMPWIRAALQVAGQWMSWLYTNVVVPVWNGIRVAIAIAAAVVMTLWQGMVWLVRNVLAPVFTWLYNAVIVPVWNGIKTFIGNAWAGIKLYWTAIKWTIDNVLAPVFRWLYNAVIVPVWNGIKLQIGAAWAVIKGIWAALKWTIDNVLAPVFRWLYNAVIVPVWNGIKGHIHRTWLGIQIIFGWLKQGLGWVADKFGWVNTWVTARWTEMKNGLQRGWEAIDRWVFAPLKRGLDGVKSFFRSTVDGIGKLWSGLKAKVSEPVDKVINVVINDGFISNFNKIAEKVKIGPLPTVKFKGLARGGILPGRSSWRGGDDQLVPMRRGEGVSMSEVVADPYERARLHHMNDAVRRGMSPEQARERFDKLHRRGDEHGTPARGGQAAPGATVYNGVGGPSFTNALQHAIARTGVLKVGGVAPGWDIGRAMGMWDGAAGVKVKSGGIGANSVSISAGHLPDWWAGYYENNSIRLNANAISGKEGRRTVAAHEIGHALGLPHSMGWGRPSIMDYGSMYKVNAPTTADIRELQKIYPGGTGQPGEGSSGFFSSMFEDFTKLVDLGKLLGGIPGSGFVTDLLKGAATMMWEGVKSFAASIFQDDEEGGSDRWRGTVREALGRVGLPTSSAYIDAWLRQIQTESGGNPRAVQGNIGDINNITGDLGKGLVQVIGSTFAAHRDPELPNDQFNPLANLTAGMRYAKARYGVQGMLGAIGHGHGYARGGIVGSQAWRPQLFDRGGMIHEGLTLVDHRRSDPDYVLTGAQWETTRRAVEHTVAGGGTAGGGAHLHLHGQQYSEDRMVRRGVEEMATAFRKAGIL